MNYRKAAFAAALTMLSFGAFSQAQEIPGTIEWKIADLPDIQSVEGNPKIVETVLGPAVQFNGKSDAYFLSTNPLKGMEEATIEFIFKPDGSGDFAQRFMHLGLLKGERVMFETRVNPNKTWYFDAHTALNNGKSMTLIDSTLKHPTDLWYNVTLIIYKDMVVTYVNGEPQRWGALKFIPINEGISSIGVRQNKVNWFKGLMYKIRITPKAILPRDFQTDYVTLNNADKK